MLEGVAITQGRPASDATEIHERGNANT
jgi:hypothetical protein